MEPNLPRLMTEFQFDRSLLDRDPQTAEACEDFMEQTAVALAKFEAKGKAEAERMMANADFTAEARSRKATEWAERVRDQQLAGLDATLEARRTALARAEAKLAERAYPAPPGDIAAILRELRIGEARRQLEPLSPADRVRVLLTAAQARDIVPVLAAEGSYVPMVPAEVIAAARETYAVAADAESATMRDNLRKQIALSERVRAEAEARMTLAIRRFAAPRAA